MREGREQECECVCDWHIYSTIFYLPSTVFVAAAAFLKLAFAGRRRKQSNIAFGENYRCNFLVADFLSIKIKRLSKMLNVKMKNNNSVTILTRFKWSLLEVWCHHRDRSIHIGKACKLHHAKMNRQGLLHNGFNISLLCLLDMYIINFCSQSEQPNSAYADVKLGFASMNPARRSLWLTPLLERQVLRIGVGFYFTTCQNIQTQAD